MKLFQVNAFAILLAILAALISSAAGSPTSRDGISLNGTWDFHPNGGEERHDILVPSFWNAPQDYGYPADWLHMQHGIYRKSFTLPESMKGKQVFLRIESVSVIANLFVIPNLHKNGNPEDDEINIRLTAGKAGKERFSEINRLGALGAVPAPMVAFEPTSLDLGKVREDSAKHWHTVRLVNHGGGAATPWKIEAPEGIRFKLTEGNLRGEQDLQFQIDPAKAESATGEWKVTATADSKQTSLSIRLTR